MKHWLINKVPLILGTILIGYACYSGGYKTHQREIGKSYILCMKHASGTSYQDMKDFYGHKRSDFVFNSHATAWLHKRWGECFIKEITK